MRLITIIIAAAVILFTDMPSFGIFGYIIITVLTLIAASIKTEDPIEKRDNETTLEYYKRIRHEDALRSKRAVEDAARAAALKIASDEENIEIQNKFRQRYGVMADQYFKNFKNRIPWKGAYLDDVILAIGQPDQIDNNDYVYHINDDLSSLYPIEYIISVTKDENENLRVENVCTRTDIIFSNHVNSNLSGKQILDNLKNRKLWIGATLSEVIYICGQPTSIIENHLQYEATNSLESLFGFKLHITIDSNYQVNNIISLADLIANKHPSIPSSIVLHNLENKSVFVDATREEVIYMLGQPEQIDSKGQWKYKKLGKRGSGFAWGLVLKFNRNRVSEIRRES